MPSNAIVSSAVVRVFVPTYRRPALLRRALDSLRAQTFTDWSCEVHNDDPADSYPAELVRQLNDPRIDIVSHKNNLGPTRTFNLFFGPKKESFYSLLEDDNWWEPQFLSVMLAEIERHPDVTMAWCNQYVWEEQIDGSWRDTGAFVGPGGSSDLPRLYSFADRRQIFGALHSIGAMLLRTRTNQNYITPSDWPVAAIEPFRERMMPFPILYVPTPYATFSRTLETARSKGHAEWILTQTILAATYLKHANRADVNLSALFSECRVNRPPTTAALLFAALVEPKCRHLLRFARPVDWFRLVKSSLRRPDVPWTVLRSRTKHPDWWKCLDDYTGERFRELYNA